MEKAFVAQRVAKKLFVTEAAVDGALSEARTAMVGVHNELNEAQLRLGVRTRMDFQKPTSLAKTEEPKGIRAVG